MERRFPPAQKGPEELAGPRRRHLGRQLERLDDLRVARGIPGDTAASEPVPPPSPLTAAAGDGAREAHRRATGDVRTWEATAG